MLRRLDQVVEQVSLIVAAALVAMLLVGPRIIAEDKPAERANPAAAGYGDREPGEATATPVSAEAGRSVFVRSCGSCHTLADAGTTGRTGPALDGRELEIREALETIAGGKGTMPAFAERLSRRDLASVALYVVEASK